jgi:hypothetical protein
MLETKIEELIKALERNSDIMERIHSGEHRLAPIVAVTYEEAMKSRLAGGEVKMREAAIVEQEVSDAKKEAKLTTNTSPPSSSESAPVTYDDVKRATNAVSKISRDKAVAGLARFGVASATKLAEDRWREYVAYMTRVAAGELDPESAHE